MGIVWGRRGDVGDLPARPEKGGEAVEVEREQVPQREEKARGEALPATHAHELIQPQFVATATNNAAAIMSQEMLGIRLCLKQSRRNATFRSEVQFIHCSSRPFLRAVARRAIETSPGCLSYVEVAWRLTPELPFYTKAIRDAVTASLPSFAACPAPAFARRGKRRNAQPDGAMKRGLARMRRGGGDAGRARCAEQRGSCR